MKAQIVKCFLAALVSSLTLASCANTDDKPQDPNQNPVFVGPEWNIGEVNVTCENDSLCPDNQGILLTVKRKTDSSFYETIKTLEVYRCTATLYDSDKIVTAGHCVDDFAGADEIWFKTVDKPGKPGRAFKVSSAPLAKRSPPKSDTLQIDYGGARLETPAWGIAYAHPALELPANPSEMVALVINAKPTAQQIARQFILNAVPCRQGANALDPIDYSQNPDKFVFTDCKIYGGNSGGAVVSRQDPLSILGLISTSNMAEDAKADSLISPAVHKVAAGEEDTSNITAWGSATNARCFSMPGWPQTAPNCKSISRDVVIKTAKDLRKRAVLETFLDLAQKWFADPEIQSMFSNSNIKFIPEFEPAKPVLDLLGPKPKGVALIPVPVCVTADLPGSAPAAYFFHPLVYAEKIHSNRSLEMPVEAVQTRSGIQAFIRRQSNGDYEIEYNQQTDYGSDISNLYDVSVTPGTEYAKYTGLSGGTKKLPKCDGNEQQAMLNALKKGLAPNP